MTYIEKPIQAEIDAMQERFDTVVKDVREQSYINGKYARQAEIDELVNMLLYCNPVPAKKAQYEDLIDKHRGEVI